MYFVREKTTNDAGISVDKFYLIAELMQGKDMNNYLTNLGPP